MTSTPCIQIQGGIRPILDLHHLNKYIIYERFWMVTWSTILTVLCQNNWFATLDLQDAYSHEVILASHRKFLQFVMSECHFQYIVFSFGLSSVLCVFTKCLVTVMVYLKKKGIYIFLYPDEWLLRGRSIEKVFSCWHHPALAWLYGSHPKHQKVSCGAN